MNCNLCPNLCNVDRAKVIGLCHSDDNMRICRIAPHFGEEPIISGTNGSGTIFFSGCNMNCEFCQNYQISKQKVGKIYSPIELSKQIKILEEKKVHNINFVTPTHFSDKICETLDIYRPNIPIVYNTSSYELPKIINKMNNYVDIYLADLKYGDNSYAKKFSNCNNYLDYAIESIAAMCDAKPLIYDSDGMLLQGVIVRHLILPENIENTKKVLDIYAEKFISKSIFSIMSQFVPCYQSSIKRKLTPLEYKIVINYMEKKGIENGFMQELSSATTEYIPEFDF
ncbi:MAG: radical SAM protein [Clostridia bacterium]